MSIQSTSNEPIVSFSELTPDTVINLVEEALGTPLTNLCRQMASYINRVFELEMVSREGVIVKFYRPGRWSRTALQDEHDFLFELAELELPVIPPLKFSDGSSLREHRGMYFALFPKRSGRGLDEPSYDDWEALGRLIARVHNVGAVHPPRDRITLSPKRSTLDNIRYILRKSGMTGDIRSEYERVAMQTVEMIVPLFEGIEMIRIHGDCHAANIIHRLDGAFHLIDFDDMAFGPPVQDLWMLLPDHSRASLVEIDFFLEGYTTFREFDRRTLKLIEPLRAMRFIHFTAWCAAQAADGGFAKLAPGWGTREYWTGEIRDLKNQQEEIGR
jgi:Ser/Thr protein kinase RdoA (MazF antagonist)